MSSMFLNAESFTQNLCTASWLHSNATKDVMFAGSSRSISSVVCTTPHESVTTLAARQTEPFQYRTREVWGVPRPERELIGHMLISKAAISSTIATTRMCPICGTFKKSGRASCCAPGGAWYQQCGGAGSRSVDHTWIEGTKACERKFEAACMQIHVCSVSVMACLC